MKLKKIQFNQRQWARKARYEKRKRANAKLMTILGGYLSDAWKTHTSKVARQVEKHNKSNGKK